jgi:hypothetical protein
MNQEQQIYKIPVQNYDSLIEKIAKLNKKAVKLNSPKIKIKLIETKTEIKKVNGNEYITHYNLIDVDGIAPKLVGNYVFVGTIRHVDGKNLLLSVPSKEIPFNYKDTGPVCDHCQYSRKRNDTYVVLNETGEFKQVGSKCVKDFLGWIDPKLLALCAQFLEVFEEHCGEGEGFGMGVVNTAPMSLFLEYVAETALRHGYITSAMAQKTEGKLVATSGQAWGAMFPHNAEARAAIVASGFKVTDKAKEMAAGTIAWLSSLEPKNNFEHNMKVLAGLDFITRKDIGIAAFAVQAYTQDLIKKYEKTEKVASEYVGVVGEKIDVKVLVKKHVVLETMYGYTHLYIMNDENGNNIKWFSSRKVMDEAKSYGLVGRVTKQEEYQGSKQTIVTRAKVVAL